MKNHFDIFSLPTAFEINLDELEKKYLEFQRNFHPDNFSGADIEKSIAINEAYEILKNDLRRASHILQLNNIDLENDSTAPKVDSATLYEVLELREQIFTNNATEIGNLKKDLSEKIKYLINETAKKLQNKEFGAASQILIKAKYFDKTLQDLKRKK